MRLIVRFETRIITCFGGGKILENLLDHVNLMRSGSSEGDDLTESKRLNNQQVTKALSF